MPKPTLKPGEVLVKVLYSTVNPYDQIILSSKNQVIPGNEGSGFIFSVAKGGDQSLVGKKVAFIGNAWT